MSTLERVIGYTTAITEVSRESGRVVGNSLKSIFSRITSIDEAVDGLNAIGISVKNSSGEMRNVDDILDDLGAKWSSLTKEQQQNLGVSIAGRYQLSRFLILMERYDEALKATETATYSSGSAMRENSKYLDSYEAKINHVKNAWTETTIKMQEAFIGDAIVGFTTAGTSSIKILTFLIEKLGLLPPLFALAGMGLQSLSTKFKVFSMFNLSGEFDKAKNSLIAQNAALEQSKIKLNTHAAASATATVATRTFTTALKALRSVLLPMLVAGIIGYGISKITEHFAEATQRAEELKRKLEEVQDVNKNAVTVNREEVDALLSAYQQLDARRPENGFDNVEKEREYLNIQNELAELFPAIVDHIDTKGQAHLKNAEEIQKEVEATERLLEAERELRIAEAKQTIKSRQKDLKPYEKNLEEFDSLKEYYEKHSDSFINSIEKLFNKSYDKDIQNTISALEQKAIIEEGKISELYRQMSEAVVGIFKDMTHEVEQTVPQITESIEKSLRVIDFSEMNADEIEDVTLVLSGFANTLQSLYEQGNSEGFNNTVKALNTFLSEELKVDNVDLLELSYDSLHEIMLKVAEITELSSTLHNENEEAMLSEAEAADELSNALQSPLEAYDNAIEKIEELNGILNELDDGGVSADTIGLIMEKYEEFLPLLSDEIALREAIEGAIEDQTDIALESIEQQMMHNEAYYKQVISSSNSLINELAKNYNIDLENFTSLAQAKQAIEVQLLSSLGKLWGNYVDGVARSATQMSQLVGETGKLTEQGIKEFQSLASNPEAQRQAAWALASHQKRLKEMENVFQNISKIEFKGANLNVDDIGRNIRDTGRKADEAGKKAKKSAKDTAKEYKLSTYVADTYAQALEQINSQLERQSKLTSEFPKYSKEYRDSLNLEIELLKSKSKLIESQSKELEKQIKSGNIKKYGVVESGSVWDYSSSSSSSGGSPSSVAGYYLNNFRITSPYGMRTHPISGKKTMHHGVDFANGKHGDPVKALRSGKVITATYSPSAGNWVVIQQDDGTVAKYMHMQKNLRVRAGQQVKAGQVLGSIGSTGQSTGAHLHLQVERGGRSIDPVSYMKGLPSSSGGSSKSKAQAQSEASQSAAQRLADIDQAKTQLLSMEDELFSISRQIEEMYFAIVESHLAEFDHNRHKLDKKLAEIDYYQTRYDDKSESWAKQQLKREEILREQNKIHKDSIKWLEKEIKNNKNLTKAQKMRLDDMLLERQIEMWNLERTILDERIKMANQLINVYKEALQAQKDATLKMIDEMIKEIDEKEKEDKFLKQRDKKQKERQEILDEISQWAIDDSDEARKKIKELTEQLQGIEEELEELEHNKAIEERKDALNERKETVSKEYDNLINDEKAFADMRSNIIKGNTKNIEKELNRFYKEVGKLTDELGKSAVKNLQRSIKQMNTYIQDPKFKNVKIPHFDTGGMVRASSSSGGLVVAHDKEIILNRDDTKNLLDTIKINKQLFDNLKIPKIPELAANNNTTNSILYDIDFHVDKMVGDEEGVTSAFDSIIRGIQGKGGKI